MILDLVVRADGRSVPVVVQSGPDATVGGLRRALADLVRAGESGLAGLDDALPLAASGLTAGSTVEVGARPGEFAVRSRPGSTAEWEAAVAGGLHAGPACPLPPGREMSVGRASGRDLTLPDPEVSRSHVLLRASEEGVSLADTGSANGVRLGAWRLTDETVLDADRVVGLGASVLAVRRPEPTEAEMTPVVEGVRRVDRPPRITAPVRPPELTVPARPAPPTGPRFPWAVTLLPPALCAVLALVLPRGFSVYPLLMMLMTPLVTVAALAGDRRAERHRYRTACAEYELRHAEHRAAVDQAVAAEERAERLAHPDPAALVRRSGARTGRPAASLWQRRPADADFLRLRVGLADRPARLELRPDPDERPRRAEPPAPPTARDVPVTVDLGEAGVLGVAGPRAALLSAARALLLQAAVLHSPAELGLVLLTGRDTARDWEWAAWLPHTLPDSAAFACTRMTAADAEQAKARLTALRELIAARATDRSGPGRNGPPAERVLLVVLDGLRGLRDLPGLDDLLSAGPAAGVHVLCLEQEETALADECGATLVAAAPAGSRAELRCAGLPPVREVLVDGLAADEAEAAARALAALRPRRDRGGTPPEEVRFLTLAGPDAATPEGIRARWARSPHGRSTRALLGAGPDGEVGFDLGLDGPHALIAGTSGSGKSELLQTFVVSLAAANTPDALNFVLVDYKGGSAFASCADLPHCVGMVTDLDGRLAARALDSLSAELRRREKLFAEAGARDIEDHWRRTGARLPRLVIVVDEFAALAEDLPGFVDGVVDIGMRGRSLGVHVVLATQRPGGSVTAGLRANLNLRICLRVTSPEESRDVIGTADAARIPVRAPGRGHLRIGDGAPVAFQTARVSLPHSARQGPPAGDSLRCSVRRFEDLGLPPGEAVPAETGGRTDLEDLVEAIGRAAAGLGVTAPPGPWLPPLPDVLTMAEVPSPETDGTSPSAAIGLVDRPHVQSQEAFVLAPERTGPVAIGGAVRSGRSTVLRTLAVALASSASPADLHLYGIDRGDHALAPLTALPHCGAVVDAADAPRLDRLLTVLQAEVKRRRRVLARGGYGSVAEQRAAVRAGDRLSHAVVLLDGLESFLARHGETDGGRTADLLQELLRDGPAAGVFLFLTTDRTGFRHRIASAVSSRLVLRQASDDDAAAFGVPPHGLPRRMPPGRGVWKETGEEVQIALPGPDPSGRAQRAAIERTGAALADRWKDVPPERLALRVDPLPEEISRSGAERLRTKPRPEGPAVCTFAVGGDRLGPVDVDLAEAGCTFLVSGPRRSGRSSALAAVVAGLAGRLAGALPVLVVTPRPSPLRELVGEPGVLDVLEGDRTDLASELSLRLQRGPLALVVDDGEALTDPEPGDVLAAFARDARDNGSLLIASATTADVLANPYRGWIPQVMRSRSGLLLGPVGPGDGEVFKVRPPRSSCGVLPPGRALLIRNGELMQVHLVLPR